MHTVNILAKGWCIVSRWVHLQQSLQQQALAFMMLHKPIILIANLPMQLSQLLIGARQEAAMIL